MVQYHYPNLNRIRVIYEFSKKEVAQKINNWLNNNPGFIGIVEVRANKILRIGTVAVNRESKKIIFIEVTVANK
ncbi:hypothetical protein CTN00_03590 [Fusobacterium pseudoperiodonticum]|uniref:hypothetical protein n=1 Tax=Fusobacterium pseudoperiodonticum TaxID=2663009 RepID=UPI000C1C1128|nr:hypothetical protein [Fusobacterium pseudoperiodonticum]ATV72141.1 hypothetical protein CTN00_03590 [Fusobacterium pseudoperiodonticum]